MRALDEDIYHESIEDIGEQMSSTKNASLEPENATRDTCSGPSAIQAENHAVDVSFEVDCILDHEEKHGVNQYKVRWRQSLVSRGDIDQTDGCYIVRIEGVRWTNVEDIQEVQLAGEGRGEQFVVTWADSWRPIWRLGRSLSAVADYYEQHPEKNVVTLRQPRFWLSVIEDQQLDYEAPGRSDILLERQDFRPEDMDYTMPLLDLCIRELTNGAKYSVDMVRLLNLPVKRPLKFSREYLEAGRTFCMTTNKTLKSMLAYCVGELQECDCNRCEKACSPFPKCVCEDGSFVGACTNCAALGSKQPKDTCTYNRKVSRFEKRHSRPRIQNADGGLTPGRLDAKPVVAVQVPVDSAVVNLFEQARNDKLPNDRSVESASLVLSGEVCRTIAMLDHPRGRSECLPNARETTASSTGPAAPRKPPEGTLSSRDDRVPDIVDFASFIENVNLPVTGLGQSDNNMTLQRNELQDISSSPSSHFDELYDATPRTRSLLSTPITSPEEMPLSHESIQMSSRDVPSDESPRAGGVQAETLVGLKGSLSFPPNQPSVSGEKGVLPPEQVTTQAIKATTEREPGAATPREVGNFGTPRSTRASRTASRTISSSGAEKRSTPRPSGDSHPSSNLPAHRSTGSRTTSSFALKREASCDASRPQGTRRRLNMDLRRLSDMPKVEMLPQPSVKSEETQLPRIGKHLRCGNGRRCIDEDVGVPQPADQIVVYNDRTFDLGEATKEEVRFIVSQCSCENTEKLARLLGKAHEVWIERNGETYEGWAREDELSNTLVANLNEAVATCCPSRTTWGPVVEVIDLVSSDDEDEAEYETSRE